MTAPTTTGLLQCRGSQSNIAQITTDGHCVEAGKRPRTILDVLTAAEPCTGDRDKIHKVKERLGSSACAAYLHVPFCFHKCHYCDFYSIVDSQNRQDAFIARLIRELQMVQEIFTQPAETVFVGGGTPTLLSPEQWQRLLPSMRISLGCGTEAREFTVEANPETITPALASVLAEGGVNRVSVGAQSFNPVHLKALERWHDPRNVERSVEILRAAGIGNINLDLIFAVPGQTVEQWLDDLDAAVALRPTHISCYGLMYESNTPLTVRMRNGQVTPVEQDVEAAMYDAAIERLADAGYEHYEISNWAARGSTGQSARCQHNMLYWTNANWWACGPSASGHVNNIRWKNIPRLGEYLDHGPWPSIVDAEATSLLQQVGEEFMLGLRLIEGMNHERVERLLDGDAGGAARRAAIQRHGDSGLLESTGTHLRLSRRGLMLADTVLSDLV